MPLKLSGQYLKTGSIPTAALGGGVVSGSGQVTTLLPVGIVSSSAQLPSGTVSSSAQVPASNPVQYVTSSNPIITVNPTAANVFWANTASGEFFMNISTASNANEWVGSSGSYVFPATALTTTLGTAALSGSLKTTAVTITSTNRLGKNNFFGSIPTFTSSSISASISGLTNNGLSITGTYTQLLTGSISTSSITASYGAATNSTSIIYNGIAYIVATGGTITTSGSYKFHTFLSSSTFTVSSLGYITPVVDYLVIAGGGSGGLQYGGGGGAGGLQNSSSASLTTANYTVIIGAGAAKAVDSGTRNGTQGSNSVFSGSSISTITSTGGGYGGGDNGNVTQVGGAGGSGGGGTAIGSAVGGSGSQGFNGGTGGGGVTYGGGGGGAGETGNTDGNGYGGDGSSTYSSWGSATSTGENVGGTYYYAGGGGGSLFSGTQGAGGSGGGGHGGGGGSTQVAPASGTANTGGGGGAGWGGYNDGGAGGSGVVIIRYQFQD